MHPYRDQSSQRGVIVRRVSTTLFLAAVMMLTLSGVAWAHTTVSPEQVSAGSTETFTVSTPGEKSAPIVEERVQVPAGFEVTSVSSPDGWRGSVEGGSVVWAGGEIGEGEEQQFTFEARVPAQTGAYPWRAFDTYEDGSVSEWSGGPDSDNPASITEVIAGEAAASSGHGSHGGSHEADLPETGGVSPLLLSTLAVALCACGLGGLLLGRRLS